jgi:hypothetical protein
MHLSASTTSDMLRCFVAISCAMLCSRYLPAQVASPIAVATDTAAVFGNGERPNLEFAGEQHPMNVITGDAAYESAWDDNILGTSGTPVADLEQSVAADLLLQRQGEYLQATLGYAPYYQTFLQHSEYNQFDQAASADIKLIQSEAWSIRLRDSYLRQTGPYLPPNASALPAAPGAPGGLNTTIYAPLSREQANSGRIDITYQRSLRTGFDLFGGYDDRSYSLNYSTATSLYTTRGPNLGAELAWRSSEHSIIGVLGLAQHLEIPDATGVRTSIEIATLLPTLGFAPRPGWNVQVYGGPQAWAQPGIANTAIGPSRNWGWAGGGTVARQAATSAIYVTANHLLTDGGGLLDFVESSQVEAGLRRRVSGRWDASLDATFARNSEVGSTAGPGSLTEVTTTASLTHPLPGHMVLHAGYELERQLSAGSAPAGAEFHRNRIACGLIWQFGAVPLGR